MAIETSEPYYLLSIKAEFVKTINKFYIKNKNSKKTDMIGAIYASGFKQSTEDIYDPRIMLQH